MLKQELYKNNKARSIDNLRNANEKPQYQEKKINQFGF